MSERCAICGAVISDNNITGIGYECLAALNKAKSAVFFSNEEYAFRYNFLIEVELVKSIFLNLFKEVKFRSAFKKSFFESISNSTRISRKQLDIMKDMIGNKDIAIFNDMLGEIREAKDNFKDNICLDIQVTREQVEIARALIKKNK